jgi:hypothetical protein
MDKPKTAARWLETGLSVLYCYHSYSVVILNHYLEQFLSHWSWWQFCVYLLLPPLVSVLNYPQFTAHISLCLLLFHLYLSCLIPLFVLYNCHIFSNVGQVWTALRKSMFFKCRVIFLIFFSKLHRNLNRNSTTWEGGMTWDLTPEPFTLTILTLW